MASIIADFAQVLEGEGLVTFGKPPAIRACQQAVMQISWHRQCQEFLKDPVNMGGVEKVLAANDVGHTL